MTGKLIVFEGVDYSGKSTVSNLFAEELARRDSSQSVLWTCEPSPEAVGYNYIRDMLGKRIDHDNWSLALAFAVNRADHCQRVIAPALANGVTVVCDRFLLSSAVYQVGEGVSLEDIFSINRTALVPDLTLILDISGEEQALRRLERGGAQEIFDVQYRGTDYAYCAGLLMADGQRVYLVNGEQPADRVLAECLEVYDERI